MCTTPNDTCLRSFFLKVFFLPFFSGAAAPPAVAAAGFAIVSVPSSQFPVPSGQSSVVSRQYSLPLPVINLLATDHWQLATRFLPPPSSFARLFPCADPCGYGHW